MMQLRCWTRIFFGAGVLCLAQGKAPAQSSGQGQDSLNEARKDLQELPSTVNTPNDASRKAIDTEKLDLVIPSNGAGANPPSQRQSSDLPSPQGWLLDALAKDKSSSDLTLNPRANAGAEARREKMDTTAAAETAKAWTPLLQTWLLPQSRALIPTLFGSDATNRASRDNAGSGQTNARAGGAASSNFALRSPSSSVPAEWLTGDATYHDPLAQRPNPYLENNDAVLPGSTDFHMPRLTAPVSTLRPTEVSATGEESLYSRTGDNKNSARHEQEMPSPTAPVLNQQKYFPQLDRF